MQYNTSRDRLTIREYGRGVQKMINHLMTIKDTEERQANAEALVEVMGILNPQNKNIEDYQHKLWDHMIMMSDYKLDVKSPYEMPTAEVKEAKPAPLPYPKSKLKWTHLGKKFQALLEKALDETDEEKKQGYIHILALFMKIAYGNWHEEKVHDDMIKDELIQISKGALVYEAGRFGDFVDSGEGPIINHKSFSIPQQSVSAGGYKKNKSKYKKPTGGGSNQNNGNPNSNNSNHGNRSYKKHRRPQT